MINVITHCTINAQGNILHIHMIKIETFNGKNNQEAIKYSCSLICTIAHNDLIRSSILRGELSQGKSYCEKSPVVKMTHRLCSSWLSKKSRCLIIVFYIKLSLYITNSAILAISVVNQNCQTYGFNNNISNKSQILTLTFH